MKMEEEKDDPFEAAITALVCHAGCIAKALTPGEDVERNQVDETKIQAIEQRLNGLETNQVATNGKLDQILALFAAQCN